MTEKDLSAKSSAATAQKKSSSKANIVREELSRSESGLSIEQAKRMLLVVADVIIESEPQLSQADRDLGDGDHGLGMKRGFTALKKSLADESFTSLQELFKTAGMALLTTMGGASGVVFGSLFLAGDKTLHGATDFGSHEISHLLHQSLTDVMKRGGAKPGDKTMIDALSPAADAAKENLDQPISESINAIADAAIEGREASKAMLATMGRAKTLGEKTIGLPDAGAISVSIILDTMRKFIATEV